MRIGAATEMREKLIDVDAILKLVDNHELCRRQPFPFVVINEDVFAFRRRVPNKLMRHLIGAGLVQPPVRGSISWVYRITNRGKKLVERG